MKNKLGLSYIIFEDTIDHLEWSIKPIRNSVDYINCVYQSKSFFGNSGKNYKEYLIDLLHRKILDNVLFVENDVNIHPRKNQLNNRNVGLKDIINVDCTHFLLIDGDEYYNSCEFLNVKNKIFEEGFESSACKMITYYKYLNVILDPPEEYYCPFIYKIKNDLLLGMNTNFPVDVDINRIYHDNNFLHLERKELQMHHMSSVRRDFSCKLNNHSSKAQFENHNELLINYFNQYTYPNKIMFQASPYKWYNAKLIDLVFENPNFASI